MQANEFYWEEDGETVLPAAIHYTIFKGGAY